MPAHIIVCGSETEINIVTQQHLAVSALISRLERTLSAGLLNYETEDEYRALVAAVRAAFKMPPRGYDQTLARVAHEMAADA